MVLDSAKLIHEQGEDLPQAELRKGPTAVLGTWQELY